MPAQTKTILGLDYGNKRIGVALASFDSLLPQPKGTITNDNHAINNIENLINDNHASTVIIGLPRGLNGQDTDQTKLVRVFAKELGLRIKAKIIFQDEALTSRAAEEELNRRRVSYNRSDVDALAATYILRDYIVDKRESL